MQYENGIVVVGCGQAASQFAASVRQMGYVGPITLIGEEHALPYQRPPLSKAYLKGAADAESLKVRPVSFYESAKCQLLLGETVASIDCNGRHVLLGRGTAIPYDKLVLATGARARIFDGLPPSAARVHYLRSLEHAETLKAALPGYRRIGVIGAGYVGMEVAASARQSGIEVIVFEAGSRVMQRSVGEATSVAVHALHESNGVDIRLNTAISRVEETPSGLLVRTNVGNFEVDAIIVGIGAAPNIELAQAAGISCGRGILVDANGCTSDPHVFAIGDCTEQTHALYGPGIRLESVQNAVDQAKSVAAVLAGKTPPRASIPWFWSDQYSHRVQVAGLPQGHDEVVVRKPAEIQPGKATQSIWYLRQGRVLSVEALDAPEEFMAGKVLIQSSATVNASLLADASKALLPKRAA